MGRPFSPKICPFPWRDLDPHLIHGSPGPPKSSTQKAARSVQPFLQGSLVWQTDRPTDHATRSVRIGRIYVRSTAMRPNNTAAAAAAGVVVVVVVVVVVILIAFGSTDTKLKHHVQILSRVKESISHSKIQALTN